ncbi:lactate utilization protein C [Streptomyces sp. NPDC091287]|uniref:LutC/YkgG family protein n=1 Tax=Streptomyces sp. NPDC091287 TaxID=3365988 RepID=UPI00380DF1AE
MSHRDMILDRIRRATAAHTGSATEPEIARDYLRVHGTRTPVQSIELLAEYRARVHHADAASLPRFIAQLLAERASRRIVVPAGLPQVWLSATDAEQIPDTADLTARALDAVDGVVTGCTLAIAETGTLVLDAGDGQGRRRITLVPDHHICVVHAPGQVVDSVPQALERLDPARPLTWISGPSATSDIELDRVEGVHGPRTLDVVLLHSPTAHTGTHHVSRST